MLMGHITARAAGMAWYASAIIGLRGEVQVGGGHRLPGKTGDKRVWGDDCDGILGFDAELDKGVCKVLNPLGPGGL